MVDHLPSTVDDLNRCRHNRFPSPSSDQSTPDSPRTAEKKKKQQHPSGEKAVLVTSTAADGKGPSLLRQPGNIITPVGLFLRLAHLPPVGGGAKTPAGALSLSRLRLPLISPHSLFPGQARAREVAVHSRLEPHRPAAYTFCSSPLSEREPEPADGE